jgi:hypothetical protein
MRKAPAPPRVIACCLLLALASVAANSQAMAGDAAGLGDEAAESDLAAEAPKAPEGLLDLPALRSHRALFAFADSLGVLGSLALTGAGIYGFAQDFQDGFAARTVQGDLVCAASGMILSSFFSACLGSILDAPTSR